MERSKDNLISKLLASNWVITLTATLLGVFLALFLNESVSTRDIRNQRKIATQNILLEFESNKKKLDLSINRHTELFDFMVFLDKYKGDNEFLVVHQDSMAKFKRQYPDLMIIEDSTLVDEHVYKYKGQTNLDFSFSKLDMTDIAWQTLKNNEINSTYNFECLMYLQTTGKLLNEFLIQDEKFLENLRDLLNGDIENEDFIGHLELLISFEKGLLDNYESCESKLKDCG